MVRDINPAKLRAMAARNAEASKKANTPQHGNRSQQSDRPQNNGRRDSYKDNFQTDESVKDLGGKFYNPYTFIPFPKRAPERHEPSLLTADENGSSEKRYTGVLNLSVKTVSPLLSMDVENKKPEGTHFKYRALTIGNDVIVPATSVRGSLRTLMTILNGGTLGYMDKNMWLCQGRDSSMNLVGKNGAKKTELAEVVEAGDSFHDGTIQRGETRMVSLGALNDLFRKNGKENVTMCDVVQRFRNEGLERGIAEGREQGRMEGREEGIRGVVETVQDFSAGKEEAVRRLRRALEELIIEGIETNAEFMHLLTFHPDFIKGKYSTAFWENNHEEIEQWLEQGKD